jgi:hypothetical protein
MFTIMVVTFLSSDKLAAAKNKSRDFYRGFGGISELSFYCFTDWLRFCTSAASVNQ